MSDDEANAIRELADVLEEQNAILRAQTRATNRLAQAVMAVGTDDKRPASEGSPGKQTATDLERERKRAHQTQEGSR